MVKLENGWTLRLRQEECHDKLINAYKNNNKEFLLAAVCRFGKTVTTLQSLKDLAKEENKESQAIIVLCTMNVKSEWADACDKVGFDSTYCKTPVNDIDFNNLGETGKHVIYVSTQKLGNGSEVSKNLIKWFNRHEGFKTIVYDECHLGSGTERTKNEIIDRLNFDFKVYLSGTPYRNHLREGFKFDKDIGQDLCYIYSMTDEREDFNNKIINDYTPVKLNMMVLDYQKEMEDLDTGEIKSEDLGISSKYFQKLFKEPSMKPQAIEFLQKIIDFSENKKVYNGLFFVPALEVGRAIVKKFASKFKDKIEFRSLCDDYKNNSDQYEDELKLESEAEKLNAFFDAPNPDNKIRIAITCNKCGTGTTIRNLDFVAFLKDATSAISFIQQSQRVRTPKEGKTEAYVLCFNQWTALKAFQDHAMASYPKESVENAIRGILNNGAISLTLNLKEVLNYEDIIDLLSSYHPGETLFEDLDMDINLDKFTFIMNIEDIKKKLLKKYTGLRKDSDFNKAKTLDDLKKALQGNEAASKELNEINGVNEKDFHQILTEIYVKVTRDMFLPYGYNMDLKQARDYDNYGKNLITDIETSICTFDLWKELNTKYCTYFPKVYRYLENQGAI